MKNSEIINIIRDIQRDFNARKSGGHAFINYLAAKIDNTIDEDKTTVINLLLQELKSNENDLRGIGLAVFEEIRSDDIGFRIYEIYQTIFNDLSENWKYEFIKVLFNIGYQKPKAYYNKYVMDFLNSKKDLSQAFVLLILYCNVDIANAMNFLSKFIIDLIKSGNEKELKVLRSHIGLLISEFNELSENLIGRLIMEVGKKDCEAGLIFQNILLNYMESKHDKIGSVPD